MAFEKLVSGVKQFVREEDGVTAIEYGLIAALVAVGIIAALQLIGADIKSIFEKIADATKTASGRT